MAAGDFRKARGILAGTHTEPPEVTIRRMRDADVLAMGAALEEQAENDQEPVQSPACTPTPRALVALSEDRQWLVVLSDATNNPWSVYRHSPGDTYLLWACKPDTGQGADAVLADWLARHDGR